MCGIAAYSGASERKRSQLRLHFSRIKHRGPDQTADYRPSDTGWIGFHRLRIMDTSTAGDQPFHSDSLTVVCNGEIYNHTQLRARQVHWQFRSDSDCEVLLPLLKDGSLAEAVEQLDGEFAFIYHDEATGDWGAARDPMGIRPLFYGQDEHQDWYFASELKVLTELCEWVEPFPPGHYFRNGTLTCFHDHSKTSERADMSQTEALAGIHDLLIDGVKKRLPADVPVGFLLSGGLDSSLVCSIAARHLSQPIRTFAIGIEGDAIDTRYAREVAEFIGAEHTEVIFSREDAINALEEVVGLLETWDITTVRASLGMYLLAKHIRTHTDIRVILTGEVSDELFGYKYTDFAPSAAAFQEEAAKRIRELYVYDVLRADRCIAGASLEARVPFSDKAFVDFVMSIPASLKMNTQGIGKYLLRAAFEEGAYLPEHILWREKAAFSDGVGHSMVDSIIEFAGCCFSDEDLTAAQGQYEHRAPYTAESLLYRQLFESRYPGRAAVIPDFWMPNREWEHCNVSDPSARVLSNYGGSGS